MRFLLLVVVLLSGGSHESALAQAVPQELLTAEAVYLRDRGGDRKLLDQIRQQVKQWERWELRESARDADLVLVLTVDAKTVEKIQLKSLEEPHATQPAEEYEVRTLTAQTRKGRDLASFSTRFGWTAARDARELVQKFKDLIQKAEKNSEK
jgi:hypothetical protein